MPQFLKYSPHILGTSTCCDLHMNTGQGGGCRGAAAPRLFGRLGQSGNIRFTVEQYWLIIKINRRNYLNIGGNMLYHSREWRKNIKVIINYNSSSRHPPPPPPPSTTILESVHRKFVLRSRTQTILESVHGKFVLRSRTQTILESVHGKFVLRSWTQTILESVHGKFVLRSRAQWENVGQISFHPPNFSLPVRLW